MVVNAVDLQNVDNAYQYFSSFMQKLQPTDEETGAFYHIVTSLSDVSKANYSTLRRAYDSDDQVVLAWTCRNLLELAIFAKYVLISKENAKEFADARLVDGLEIANSLKKLEEYQDSLIAPNPPRAVGTFDSLIDQTSQQMKNEGVTRTKFLGTGELAKLVGMQQPYEIVNKLCSKFVHPTAWSILTFDRGPARFPDARDLLFLCGAEYFAMVHAEILPHVRQWGLHHAP